MKKFILVLFSLGSAFGQNTGQNVVNQILRPYTALVTGTYTFNYTPIQNIGQSSHSVTIRYSSATANPTYSAVIQGSWDNSTYFSLGPTVSVNTAFTHASSGIFQATGYQSFPYLRVQVTASSSQDMTLGVWYSGSSSPSIVISENTARSSNIFNAAVNVLATGANTALLTASAGTRISLYSLSVYPSAGATALHMWCGISNVDATDIGDIIYVQNLATIGKIEWGSSIRQYVSCPDNAAVWYNLTSSTTNVALNLTYRLE